MRLAILLLMLIFSPALSIAQSTSGQAQTLQIAPSLTPDFQSNYYQIEETDPKVLAKYSPLELRKQRSKLRQAGAGIARFAVHEVPPELLAFKLAEGVVAWMNTGSQPSAIYQYWKHSVQDPIAWVSFVGFMAANRSVPISFRALGLLPDLRTDAGKADFHQRQLTNTLPKRYRIATALQMPMGMGLGLFASSAIHELVMDADLRTCSKKTEESMLEYEPSDYPSARELACQRAWDRWVTSRAITKLAPAFSSMMVSMYAQFGVINPLLRNLTRSALNRAAGAEVIPKGMVLAKDNLKVIGGRVAEITAKNSAEKLAQSGSQKMVLQGARVVFSAGSPVLALVINVGSLVMFIQADPYILPYIQPIVDPPIVAPRFANLKAQMNNEIETRNKLNWQKDRTDSVKTVCNKLILEDLHNSSKNDLLYSPSAVAKAQSCNVQKPSELLTKYVSHQRDWRRSLLANTWIKIDSWRTYTHRFISRYAATYQFYRAFVAELNRRKLDPQNLSSLGLDFVNHRTYIGAEKKQVEIDPNKPVDSLDQMSLLPAKGATFRQSSSPLGNPMESAMALSLALEVASFEIRTITRNYIESKKKNPKASLSAKEKRKLVSLMHVYEPLRFTMDQFEARENNSGKFNHDAILKRVPEARAQFENLNEFEKSKLLVTLIDNLVGTAFSRLTFILDYDPDFGVRNIDPQSDSIQKLAETNPFLKLRLILGDIRPGATGEMRVRTLVNESIQGLDELSLLEGVPLELDKMKTRTLDSFLLASMACGPRVTNSNNETGMIRTKRGYFIDFQPPAILDDGGAALCNAQSIIKSEYLYTLQHGLDVYKTKLIYRGKTYNNLLEVLKENIPQQWIDDPNEFENWWKENVEPKYFATLDQQNLEFQAMVKKDFIGKISTGKYYDSKYKLALSPIDSIVREAEDSLDWLDLLYKNESPVRQKQYEALKGNLRIRFANLKRLASSDLATANARALDTLRSLIPNLFVQGITPEDTVIEELNALVSYENKPNHMDNLSAAVHRSASEINLINGLLIKSHWGYPEGPQEETKARAVRLIFGNLDSLALEFHEYISVLMGLEG